MSLHVQLLVATFTSTGYRNTTSEGFYFFHCNKIIKKLSCPGSILHLSISTCFISIDLYIWDIFPSLSSRSAKILVCRKSINIHKSIYLCPHCNICAFQSTKSMSSYSCIARFQKYPYPFPQTVIGNSDGVGD